MSSAEDREAEDLARVMHERSPSRMSWRTYKRVFPTLHHEEIEDARAALRWFREREQSGGLL